MKHSIFLKFMALLMVAVSAVCALGGGAGIVAMESAGLYVNGLEILQSQEYNSQASDIAQQAVNLYVAETLGKLPYKLRKNLYPDPQNRGDAAYWRVEIHQGENLLKEYGTLNHYEYAKVYTLTPLYAIATTEDPRKALTPEPDLTEPSGGEVTEPTTPTPVLPPDGFISPEIPTGYLYRETENYWEGTTLTAYYLYYYEAPTYTVTVYMQEGVLDSSSMHILTALYPFRYACIVVLAVSLLVLAACFVFLCWSAGKTPDGQILPGGLNRLPLDLYVAAAGSVFFLLTLLHSILQRWIEDKGPHPGNLSILALNTMVMVLLIAGTLFALAAQLKVKNGFWWRHSFLGWCLCKLGAGIRLGFYSLRTLAGLLPLIWRWLVIALITALCLTVSILLVLTAPAQTQGWFILLLTVVVLGAFGLVCYSACAFGMLMQGVNRMSKGDLNFRISTKYLVGDFLKFANRLNSVSESARLSAQREMKSERMKSELITNVSHDIKTPLTSIINFVDLLKRPHSPEQNAEYLDVLWRQATRMKKLIDDLMELSKASTGNIAVTPMALDAEETVNQVLGEFSDKLEAANLVPVFHKPETPVFLLADGRLLWRVMSNLLSNAIKYAMPGTRIYVELRQIEGQVLLSVKNVSREQMNIKPEELMERFVQGDESRATEGSGLGLNIAKSLMEVQGGKLHLLLDGDLFKATLIFPRPPEE